MTSTISAKFYQSAGGAPLQASLVSVFPTPADYNAESGSGFGVKATNAAPTNVSDFGGHTIGMGQATMESTKLTEILTSKPGDTVVGDYVTRECRTKVTLDANWAVGKYAFAYSLLAEGAIGKVSPPFHIR